MLWYWGNFAIFVDTILSLFGCEAVKHFAQRRKYTENAIKDEWNVKKQRTVKVMNLRNKVAYWLRHYFKLT